MSLSDACFDFIVAVTSAAQKLQEMVEVYAHPEFGYPAEEILALRHVCMNVQQEPWNADAGVSLIRIATTIMRYYDKPPVRSASNCQLHDREHINE
jgi:hypothetical protein